MPAGLSLVVAGCVEEAESTKSRRDSKNMSVSGTSDRTADRRSKGVINLLFKSKVRHQSQTLGGRERERVG